MLAMVVGLAVSAAAIPSTVLGAESVQSADLIRTKDGKLHAGRILSETTRGYLVLNEATNDTYVVEFGTIQAISRGEAASSTSSPAPPPSPSGEFTPPPPPPLPMQAQQTLLPAQPSALEQANRIARAGELQRELYQLREELDDATLAGPVVKLVGATAMTVGAGAAIQMRLRVNARRELPEEIRVREEQLRVLRSTP